MSITRDGPSYSLHFAASSWQGFSIGSRASPLGLRIGVLECWVKDPCPNLIFAAETQNPKASPFQGEGARTSPSQPHATLVILNVVP